MPAPNETTTTSPLLDASEWARRIGWYAGPMLCVCILLFFHPADMPSPAVKVLAITAWISIWWVTEAVPLPVTSLLPIILFPVMSIMKMEEATAPYGHPLVFLYIGGFLLAIAIEKCGLHKRIAFSIIRRMGTKLRMIVLGFMLATGFLSMWISNTATAVMMLPMALAVIGFAMERGGADDVRFAKALLLGLAYASSIGGLATLIGTPPNVVFAGVVKDMLGMDISFLQWMQIGFPVAACMMVFAWWYITRVGFPLRNTTLMQGEMRFDQREQMLGKMSRDEKKVALVFSLMAFAWITRSFLIKPWLPSADDTMIAMAGGVALFLIPSASEKFKGLLTWHDAVKIPWGIVLLFGGGLAIADAFEVSGLAAWIGDGLKGFHVLGVFFIILLIVAIVNLLTEFTSNLATVTMILPLLVPISQAAGIPPIVLMAAATMAASLGFMMPAGTPPNAIVFGTGHLKVGDMVRTGLVLNIISVIVVTMVAYFLLPMIFKG